MGEAIVAGLIAAKVVSSDEVSVAEPDQERREHLTSTFGIEVAADGAELLPAAGVVILAVKPQVIDDIVTRLAPALEARKPPVVSIAAGVSCSRLETLLPAGIPVVRVMPNTPAMIGEGMSAISAGTLATREHLDIALELFSALGKVAVVEEYLQDAVTAVSGSGPAYVAIFVDALAEAGARHGLDRETAYLLALQTLRGTGDLLARTGQAPQDLVDAVSSPGGTTVAARGVLESERFTEVIVDAVGAAVARSKELGS